MKPFLLLSILGTLHIWLNAQNFEYALTQPEFTGSEINEILVVDDRVYLAGGLGWCHNPTVWILDTSGQFINYQVLSSPFKYGSIKNLRFDDTTRIFTALLEVSDDITFRQQSIYVIHLDQNLEPQAEFDFSSMRDGLNSKSAMLTDTGLVILTENSLHLFDRDFEMAGEIALSQDITNASKVVASGSQLLFYNDTLRNILCSVDLDGKQKVLIGVPYFSSLAIYQDFLFLAHAKGIRKYNLTTLEELDSVQFENVEEIELAVINEGFLEVILHRPEQHSLLGYYTEDLRFIFEVPFLPENERNFRGDISGTRTLYQVSTFRQHDSNRFLQNFHRRNLIPIIRKQRIAYPYSIERPALEITNVKLLNEVTPSFCNSTNGEEYCVFSAEDFLHYQLTIKNTGSIPIENIGYYTSSFNGIICYEDIGYRYRDQLDLQPGSEITITDSLQMGSIYNYPTLDFYATAPNHILMEEGASVFSLTYVTTNVSETATTLPLAIFPNPSQDYLQITGNWMIPDHETVEIISATGQVIKKQILTDNIDITYLPVGFYYIRMIGAKSIWQGNFIKQ